MLNARPASFGCLSKIFALLSAKAPLVLLALALLSGLSCGKRRAPLPPRERVTQRLQINGFQRGNQVVLTWVMPARNAAPGSVLNIARADIYRLAEPSGAPLSLSEKEFESRSLLIASVPFSDQDFGLKPFTYIDTLQLAGQPARLRYSVRLVNRSGQKAGFSNFLLVAPAAQIAEAPAFLSTELAQDAITLSWAPPTANIDGSTPPNLIGYNVYRSTSMRQPAKLLNATPMNSTEFRDEFFEFDQEYYYFVRSVSIGSSAEPVESRESNIVSIQPKDTFPPSAPSAITVAASPGTISIFFAVNPEKDIAGYRIYRSTDPTLERDKWTLLTGGLLSTNTYQDPTVQTGTTYFYYITAVDKTGNVSAPSEVVSETVR